jgi:hypothetical protein
MFFSGSIFNNHELFFFCDLYLKTALFLVRVEGTHNNINQVKFTALPLKEGFPKSSIYLLLFLKQMQEARVFLDLKLLQQWTNAQCEQLVS